jgi:hypothetical protein
MCKVILEGYRGAMLEEVWATLALLFFRLNFGALSGKKLPSNRILSSFGDYKNTVECQLKLIVLSQPVFKNGLKLPISLFSQ